MANVGVRQTLNLDSDDLCDDLSLYFSTDANMNVTAAYYDSGAVTSVLSRYDYRAYGEVLCYDSSWQASTPWPTWCQPLFCGYLYDAETGLYQVRNRYLLPPLGRWTTRDPLNQNQPAGGYQDGMSVYGYVSGLPTISVDPMGYEAEDGASPMPNEAAKKRNERRQFEERQRQIRIKKVRKKIENAKGIERMMLKMELDQLLNGRAQMSKIEGDTVADNVDIWHMSQSLWDAANYIELDDRYLLTWLRTCNKGVGAYKGKNIGGGINALVLVGGEIHGGYQRVAFCDSCEICSFTYTGGGPGHGYGIGGGASIGYVWGRGAQDGDAYTQWFETKVFAASMSLPVKGPVSPYVGASGGTTHSDAIDGGFFNIDVGAGLDLPLPPQVTKVAEKAGGSGFGGHAVDAQEFFWKQGECLDASMQIQHPYIAAASEPVRVGIVAKE